MIKKYRKKPVVIEAIEFNDFNHQEIVEWIGDNALYDRKNNKIIIKTLEGDMEASVGDFIIKGVKGEFYPCKPDIFWKTYEEYKGDGKDE